MNEEKVQEQKVEVATVQPEPEEARLRRIACGFRRDYGDLSRLHVRKGRLVGTDGRAMLCIDRECIEPMEGDGGMASVLDWMDRQCPGIDVEVDVASLAAAAPKLEEVCKRAGEESKRLREEMDTDAVYCPCCGARLDITHRYGNVYEVEEFDESQEPDLPDSLTFAKVECLPGVPYWTFLNAKTLLSGLRAASALGGVRRAGFEMDLREGKEKEALALLMEGEGWKFILMTARRSQIDVWEREKCECINLACRAAEGGEEAGK